MGMQDDAPLTPKPPISITKTNSNNPQHPLICSAQDYPSPAEIQRRHAWTKMHYPQLHISQNEYIISDVRRHPIGLAGIWIVTGLVILLALAIPALYADNMNNLARMIGSGTNVLPSPLFIAFPALLIAVLFGIGGLAATYVYVNNRYYLTNESILQFARFSLFNSADKTVNLRNVRDSSFTQFGILPRIFNYGTIRVTTEGVDESYELSFVANPKIQSEAIVDAHEQAINQARINNADPDDPL